MERAASVLRPLCGELILALRPELGGEIAAAGAALGMRVVGDAEGYGGPLAGLQAGLSSARHPLGLALAVDHPFVSASLLGFLISEAHLGSGELRAVVPEVGGKLQPTLAVYPSGPWGRRSGECLAGGERSPTAMIKEAIAISRPAVVTISEDQIAGRDPEMLSFLDVDTLEDLERARRMACNIG